jgi:surface protein
VVKGQNKTAYSVLKDSVLTFYYKEKMPQNVYFVSDLSTASLYYWKQSVKKVIFDESFKDYKPTTCYNWFGGCYNLTEIVGMSENLNTENVTDMSCMFYCCYHLSDIDLSGFKTDKVTNMQSMFRSCSKIRRLDISGFNTENVTYMNDMFGYTRLTYLDFSKLNTSNVTNMAYMFQYCGNLDFDFSGFNTTKVTNMRGMFKGCSNTSIDLSMLNTENVTNMSEMF